MKLVQKPSTNTDRYVLVDNDTAFNRLNEQLPSVRASALDVETTFGDVQLQTRPITIQLYWGGQSAYMVTEKYLPQLKPWIESNPVGVFYSAKGDVHTMHNVNLKWKGPIHDAMVVDYMVNENVKSHEGEDSLKDRYAELFGKPARKGWVKEFGKVGADVVVAKEGYDRLLPYGCQDVIETHAVYVKQAQALSRLPWVDGDNMFDHFETYGARYTSVLYEMERRGCYIDIDYFKEQSEIAKARLEGFEGEFYKAAREEMNDDGKFDSEFTAKLMGSWQQLGKLFYDILGYPEQFNLVKNKKTHKDERRRTTDAEALAKLAGMGYRLPKILDERRKHAKLREFLEGLPSHAYNHRLHTQLIQAFTLTGRLSSRDPNLQQIPRPDKDPYFIRDGFIATPGMIMLSLDYSQIEVRVAAILSRDPVLLEACKSSDIYVAMAALLFTGKPEEFWALDSVTGKPKIKEAAILRQIVKAIVLGLLFGKQAKSIANDLHIGEEQAKEFMSQFFKRFKVLSVWMTNQLKFCRRNGFVRTLTGRYRNIPDINLPRTRENWAKISHAERQTLNSPVQGSAADIIVKSQLNIADSGICKENGGYMILPVHDELLFEFPNEKSYTGKRLIDEVSVKIKAIMEHPFDVDMGVPLPVSGSVGMSWLECK